MRYLLIAGYADSLFLFRGELIAALQELGQQVHVAAPDLPPGDPIRLQLEARGLTVHNIPLRRTGTNPLAYLRALFSLIRVMRRVRPKWVLCYTIKPVIYGSLAAWLGPTFALPWLLFGLFFDAMFQALSSRSFSILRGYVAGMREGFARLVVPQSSSFNTRLL